MKICGKYVYSNLLTESLTVQPTCKDAKIAEPPKISSNLKKTCDPAPAPGAVSAAGLPRRVINKDRVLGADRFCK